jgi:hypothetical protein
VGLVIGWPSNVESTDVRALIGEPAEARSTPAAAERERPAEPPAAAVPPASPPAEPPRLTTPDAPDDATAAKQVREMLERARRALSALRYSDLTADARAQYDTVGQLMQQAEEALRVRNFVFVIKVADKAETLARRLVGRGAVLL